jgi:hypothetical protein
MKNLTLLFTLLTFLFLSTCDKVGTEEKEWEKDEWEKDWERML